MNGCVGAITINKNKITYTIVYVEHFTRWVEAFPIRDNDAELVRKCWSNRLEIMSEKLFVE